VRSTCCSGHLTLFLLVPFITGDILDEMTAIVDGYNSYFSFSKVKSGYSGICTILLLLCPCLL